MLSCHRDCQCKLYNINRSVITFDIGVHYPIAMHLCKNFLFQQPLCFIENLCVEELLLASFSLRPEYEERGKFGSFENGRRDKFFLDFKVPHNIMNNLSLIENNLLT